MNQDDFRKLLNSGGDGARRAGPYGGKRNLTSLDLDGIRKLSAKKTGKKKSGWPHREHDEQEDVVEPAKPTGTQYRDRAAERRQGIETDDIDIEEIKRLSGQSKAQTAGIVKSVPGLDLSLLSRLKQEKEKLQRAAAAEKLKRDPIHPLREQLSEVDLDKEPTFQTRLGRMVYFHACQYRSPEISGEFTKPELFLPGRMYYTFNITSEDFDSIPTSVQRSKEECPDPDDIISGSIDDITIAEVRRALERKLSAKKLRRSRSDTKGSRGDHVTNDPGETDQANATIVMDAARSIEGDDDDMDIFPDAGDYVPAYLREGEMNAVGDEVGRQGYFANLSASLTEAEMEAKKKEQEAADAWKATVRKAEDAQLQAERQEVIKARAAKLAAAQDSYDDYEIGPGDDDSDEDEDSGSKKRKGTANSKISGSTLAIDDEEKARRKKQKQGNKLENDLKKINKIVSKEE